MASALASGGGVIGDACLDQAGNHDRALRPNRNAERTLVPDIDRLDIFTKGLSLVLCCCPVFYYSWLCCFTLYFIAKAIITFNYRFSWRVKQQRIKIEIHYFNLVLLLACKGDVRKLLAHL